MRRPFDVHDGSWRITVCPMVDDDDEDGYDADTVEDCLPEHQAHVAMLLAAMPADYEEVLIEGIGTAWNGTVQGPIVRLFDWE